MILSPACMSTPRAVASAQHLGKLPGATLTQNRLFFACALAFACGLPGALHAETSERASLIADSSVGRVIEGDMIFAPGADPALVATHSVSTRGFGHDRALARWPNGVIPYAFDDAMSDSKRNSVLQAIEHYHNNTRISFVESQDGDEHDTRLLFRSTGGCASYVGRTDFADQDLFVETCSTGSIIHELGHAIGLYHEHTRRDRDNFIAVNWDAIQPGKHGNFEIITANTQEFGEYDYGSIMHYGESFFSSDDTTPTIVVPDGIEIGQRNALSATDIQTIDVMYATDLDLAIGSRSDTVTAADGTDTEGLRLDVSVSNIGVLGAHALELEISLADDSTWLTISENSGWDCAIRGAVLACNTNTIASTDVSRFELTLDPGSGSADDLNAQLISRTLDTDLNNNGYTNGQPSAIEEQKVETTQDAQLSSGESDYNPSSIGQSPDLGAASGDEGAGAGSPILLMATALGLYIRRRAIAKTH